MNTIHVTNLQDIQQATTHIIEEMRQCGDTNTFFNRAQLKNDVEFLIDKSDIFDYVVVCDETNNPPTLVDHNIFRVDIAIQKHKDNDFIYSQVEH